MHSATIVNAQPTYLAVVFANNLKAIAVNSGGDTLSYAPVSADYEPQDLAGDGNLQQNKSPVRASRFLLQYGRTNFAKTPDFHPESFIPFVSSSHARSTPSPHPLAAAKRFSLMWGA